MGNEGAGRVGGDGRGSALAVPAAYLEALDAPLAQPFPPGNRLEQLKGDRAGQYSIRINDQYRICFSWSEAGPEAVEVVDYH